MRKLLVNIMSTMLDESKRRSYEKDIKLLHEKEKAEVESLVDIEKEKIIEEYSANDHLQLKLSIIDKKIHLITEVYELCYKIIDLLINTEKYSNEDIINMCAKLEQLDDEVLHKKITLERSFSVIAPISMLITMLHDFDGEEMRLLTVEDLTSAKDQLEQLPSKIETIEHEMLVLILIFRSLRDQEIIRFEVKGNYYSHDFNKNHASFLSKIDKEYIHLKEY